MELLLKRIYKGNKYTIGKLYIDGKWFCDTIEDVVRNLPKDCPYTSKGRNCECKEKVYGETAIPVGTYKVVLSYSNKFKRILPEILNVPHFLGIRIHRGNTDLCLFRLNSLFHNHCKILLNLCFRKLIHL